MIADAAIVPPKIGSWANRKVGGLYVWSEPKLVVGVQDGEVLFDGVVEPISVEEVYADSTWLTDEEIDSWALGIAKNSISLGFKDLKFYKGDPLTPENSRAMEARYIDDLSAQGDRWRFETGKSMDDWMRYMLEHELYMFGKMAMNFSKFEMYIHYPMAVFGESVLVPGGRGHGQMPRSTYKTSLWTMSGSMQKVCKDPNERILVFSHNEAHAKKKVTEMRDRFQGSPIIQRLYPKWIPRGKKDRNLAHWVCPARSGQESHGEGTLSYAGGQQGETGAHYTHIVPDDIFDAKSVKTKSSRETTKNNIANLKFLRESDATSIFFVDTRWAPDDPTKMLLANPAYRHMIASAIDENGESIFVPLQAGGGGYTLRDLHSQWKEKPYNFHCQMMNSPMQVDVDFKDEWFQYLSYKDIKAEVVKGTMSTKLVALVDLTGTKTESSDPNALVIVAIDNLGRKIVVAAYEKYDTPFEFVEFMFNECDRWHVSKVVFQKAPVESMMKPYVDKINEKRRNSTPPKKTYVIDEYRLKGASSNKEARIASLQHPFQEGEIFFNDDIGPHTEAIDALILQLQQGDISEHDDLKDALSMINDRTINVAPRTPKSIEAPGPKVVIPTKQQVIAWNLEANQAQVRAAFERGRKGY